MKEVNVYKKDKEPFERKKQSRIIVVLDNFHSAFNVGSIFRTVEAGGIAEIICVGITPIPPNKKVLKTSRGTEDVVKFQYYPTLMEVIVDLKKRNIKIYALETSDKSKNIFNNDIDESFAILLGNEALGITEGILEYVDELFYIPMFGFKNSMNVSSAYAVFQYEIIRKLNWKNV